MPLIQIDLEREVYEAHGDAISREIQEAQVDALGIVPDDLFHVFRPHEPGELKFGGFGGVDRQSLLLIQILMVHMYSVDTKRKLFRAIVTRLEALGIRREDILIAVAENGFEDWYAGTL